MKPSSSTMKASRRLIFVLSVDTEEEFEWGKEFPQTNCKIENIKCIPKFQSFCERLQIRPTYLIDYPVSNDPKSAQLFRGLAENNKAEIGAHLHPWCTPPITSQNGEAESHVINLPNNLVEQKINVLTENIKKNIGVTPTTFRTGRWGINTPTLHAISRAGYKVDSSIYPYYSNSFYSCLNSYHLPYWPDLTNPDNPGTQRAIFELPITAGFNRPNFPAWGKVHQFLSSSIFSTFRPIGFAWKVRALRKLYLSPELTTTSDMISLVNAALKSGSPIVHMFIHSSTLLPGGNEYAQSAFDVRQLYKSIESLLRHLTDNNDVTFCTISEASTMLESNFNHYTPPLAQQSIKKGK
jgi:hypothetical protein